MSKKELENKNVKHKFDELYNSWLGIVYLFQTFDDLESVKDKQADIEAVRQLLDEDKPTKKNDEGATC
jgi:hypothetical protein